MRNLSKVKMTFNFGKHLLPVIALGLMITVSSCDNDDNADIPTISVTDVEGTYAGEMLTATLLEGDTEQPAGTDVTAEVKKDSVRFDKFPVNGIITSIVGPDLAPGIIEKVGDISYKIGYKATLSAKQDSIYLEFDPKPLELTFGEGESQLKIAVTIATPQKGNYAYENNMLKFPLTIEEIKVGETALPNFKPMSFSFELKKK